MFVQQRCMDCNTENCKRNSSGNNSATVQIKVKNITSAVVNIPVIDCAVCRGRRQCPRCPNRRYICQ